MAKSEFYLVVRPDMCPVSTNECVGPFPSTGCVALFLGDHNLWPKWANPPIELTSTGEWVGEIVIPEEWIHPHDREPA